MIDKSAKTTARSQMALASGGDDEFIFVPSAHTPLRCAQSPSSCVLSKNQPVSTFGKSALLHRREMAHDEQPVFFSSHSYKLVGAFYAKGVVGGACLWAMDAARVRLTQMISHRLPFFILTHTSFF